MVGNFRVNMRFHPTSDFHIDPRSHSTSREMESGVKMEAFTEIIMEKIHGNSRFYPMSVRCDLGQVDFLSCEALFEKSNQMFYYYFCMVPTFVLFQLKSEHCHLLVFETIKFKYSV